MARCLLPGLNRRVLDADCPDSGQVVPEKFQDFRGAVAQFCCPGGAVGVKYKGFLPVIGDDHMFIQGRFEIIIQLCL